MSFTNLEIQADHAAQALRDAPPFWAALRQDRRWSQKQDQAKFISESTFLRWIASHTFTKDEIRNIFNVIRRSFNNSDFIHGVDQSRKAAVSLYCLVACKLVAVEVFEKNNRVVSINTGVSFLCAVIATTLFGGKIQLRDVDGAGCPCHEGVFHVDLAAAGDWSGFEIERAAYCAIYQGSEAADRVTLCSGRLGRAESAQLRARLNTLREVDEISVVLVLSKWGTSLNPTPFVENYDVPLFMVSEGVDQALFGMDNEEFVYEVAEFWSGVHFNEKANSSNHRENKPYKENPVSEIHIHGPVDKLSIATGDRSVAQSGDYNTAQQNSPQGAQWDQVLAGFKELQMLAQGLPDARSQEKIGQKLTEALDAAQSTDKKPEEKAGLLKRTIEGVKDMADLVDGGEALVTRCAQVLGVLTPLLGI